MIGIEWIVAGGLALVAVAVYLLSGGKGRNPYFRNLDEIEEYRPPVKVMREYRNDSGGRYNGRVAVLRSLRHRRDGRLYLLGFPGEQGKPRTFRIDRIVSVKTSEGMPLDTRRFLIDRLGIPLELCL